MSPSADTLGEPVCVIDAANHTFELNEENLETVLLNAKIRNLPIVIVSVAGAFRKGKSFLLNFMIRYLESQGQADWIGDESNPLTGFSWRGGSERDTTGILLWNKVYSVQISPDKEVAVLLMDTQGAFDSASTVKECATVFALSIMLSSVQVYNISQNIQEDDLQHLQLFAEYGRLAMEESHETPFQKLVFLVRDWSYPYDADYGEKGGMKILERRLEISDKQHPQLQQLRRHIKACFSEVGCFLLPHPGLEVATNQDFDGRISDIRKEFVEQMKVLIPGLLASENLVPKKIGGRCLTAREIIAYFKTYVAIFQGDELPEPKSMLEATAEANNLTALANAKEYYSIEMEKICGGACPFMKKEILERKHIEIKIAALQRFAATRCMGGPTLSNVYLEKLQREIDEMFISYLKFNDSKQIVHALRTPIFLFFTMLITYMNSYLMRALGLGLFSYISTLIMLISIITLGTWMYTRISGEYQAVGKFIDDVVAFIIVNSTIVNIKYLVFRTIMAVQNIASGVAYSFQMSVVVYHWIQMAVWKLVEIMIWIAQATRNTVKKLV